MLIDVDVCGVHEWQIWGISLTTLKFYNFLSYSNVTRFSWFSRSKLQLSGCYLPKTRQDILHRETWFAWTARRRWPLGGIWSPLNMNRNFRFLILPRVSSRYVLRAGAQMSAGVGIREYPWRWRGGGVSTKFLTGRLGPEVQPLTL